MYRLQKAEGGGGKKGEWWKDSSILHPPPDTSRRVRSRKRKQGRWNQAKTSKILTDLEEYWTCPRAPKFLLLGREKGGSRRGGKKG